MSSQPGAGEQAPGFQLVNQHGEPVSLAAQRGTAVVLVFYPFAFSRVCTDELDELHQHSSAFQQHSARVFAVSVDHKYALRTYAEQRGYTFNLLSDFWPHGEVAQRYGVLDRTRGYAERVTFFITAEGRINSTIQAPLGEARSFSDYRIALESLAAASESTRG